MYVKIGFSVLPLQNMIKAVTGNVYSDLLGLWLLSQLRENKFSLVFQQDGALPHIHHPVTTLLNTHLPGQWIGRTGPTAWPVWSPNLMPPNFSLSGYTKDTLYVPPLPHDINDLKDCIQRDVATTECQMLQCLARN
jgi:hypothetical protein